MADVRTKKFAAPRVFRGTQVVFGERKHLEEVLQSVSRAKLPATRKRAEVRVLKSLIAARTRELNSVTPQWDRRFKQARYPQTTSRELLQLAASLAREDYLLARVLTEHPEAPPELLARMATHPYSAVRENVARHPHTPPDILRELAQVKAEPLWFLVACNPSVPADLKEELRNRMRAASET